MKQEIYINLDDSGKLTTSESISVYGGIVFFSAKEKDDYMRQYKKINEEIKCFYCKSNVNNCNYKCPEIKNTNIKNKDKRRIMNLIGKYYTIALVIKNNEVYHKIKKDKASKERFIDYTIKRLIVELIKEIIKNGKINSQLSLSLIINIDEQSTKTNGYYNLKDSIKEELKYGITNFNYGMQIKPILSGNLNIKLTYRDSSLNFGIQSADLVAGTVRKKALESYSNNRKIYDELNFIDFKLIFPEKKKTT